MFARLCFCACLLSASPAVAETITVNDGESYDRINVVPGRELVMNGGHVELVNNYGGVTTVNGGTTGLIDSKSHPTGGDAYVTVNGYQHNSIGQHRLLLESQSAQIEIHGYSFRADAYGVDSNTIAEVHGWLLDGSYVEIRYRRRGSPAESNTLRLVRHDPAFIDPDGDWDFDLEDLNTLRNKFGLSGDGDTNFDGVIDLADLNIVRNKFGAGYDQQGRPAEWEYSGEIPLNPGGQWYPNNPVPEPSAMALALFSLASIPSLRRYCSWPRRSL